MSTITDECLFCGRVVVIEIDSEGISHCTECGSRWIEPQELPVVPPTDIA